MGAMSLLGGALPSIMGGVQAAGAANNVWNQVSGRDDRREDDLRRQREALEAQQAAEKARAQKLADQQALAQLQERQAQEMQDLDRQAALERAKIAKDAKEAEARRLEALRRASARQRARFGAGGINAGSGGSSEAVLLGLVNESEDQRKAREASDNLRERAIEQDKARARSLNLLQATQLAERQALGRLY